MSVSLLIVCPARLGSLLTLVCCAVPFATLLLHLSGVLPVGSIVQSSVDGVRGGRKRRRRNGRRTSWERVSGKTNMSRHHCYHATTYPKHGCLFFFCPSFAPSPLTPPPRRRHNPRHRPRRKHQKPTIPPGTPLRSESSLRPRASRRHYTRAPCRRARHYASQRWRRPLPDPSTASPPP